MKVSERKGEMRVEGKGKKERTVNLTKTLRHAFLEDGYQRHRGQDRPVLEGQRGGLSVRGLQDIVERLARITRVGKRVGLDGCTAHTLRHTCADWLLNEVGLSVPEVAEILGHSDLKTTMIYLTPHQGRLAQRMAEIEGLTGSPVATWSRRSIARRRLTRRARPGGPRRGRPAWTGPGSDPIKELISC